MRSKVFIFVASVFSAIVLVITLLTAVETARINDLAAETEKKSVQLEKDNKILAIRLETSFTLDIIEQYARDRLGMQPPDMGQIIVLDGN